MKTILSLLLTLLLAAPVLAQDEDDNGEESSAPPTPAELAAESDYVLLAQLDVYEYDKRRGMPVAGKSWFDVLVPYKVPRPTRRVLVREEGVEGLDEKKCYFDENDLWEELPRYLLFLTRDGEGDIHGHPDVCALPVLITGDNRYAVRWPLERVTLDEAAEDLVQEFEFQGPGAFLDLSEMTRLRRRETVEGNHLTETDDGMYRYTRGIALEDFRRLLGAENLTRDRLQIGRD